MDYLPDQPEVDRKDDTSCHETDQDHHSILFETGQRDKSDQKSGKDIARFALASSSRRAFDDVKIEIVRTKQPRPSKLNRKGERSICAKFGGGRHKGLRDVIRPENVKNSLAVGNQIIGNDAPVTFPP